MSTGGTHEQKWRDEGRGARDHLRGRPLRVRRPAQPRRGRLDPTPASRHQRIGVGRYGWGRNKRWEYWAVTTATHLLGLTVSSLDYAGVHGVWVHDRRTGETVSHDVIDPLGRGATLPGRLGDGAAGARTRALSINMAPVQGGTRPRVTGPRIRLDVLAERPPGHEAMGAVVPWSPRLFQYTVKDVARPAVGRLWVDGTEHVVAAGESWAVLDHGRGRWPYFVRWPWGAGSGVVDGHVIGVQVPVLPSRVPQGRSSWSGSSGLGLTRGLARLQ